MNFSIKNSIGGGGSQSALCMIMPENRNQRQRVCSSLCLFVSRTSMTKDAGVWGCLAEGWGAHTMAKFISLTKVSELLWLRQLLIQPLYCIQDQSTLVRKRITDLYRHFQAVVEHTRTFDVLFTSESGSYLVAQAGLKFMILCLSLSGLT